MKKFFIYERYEYFYSDGLRFIPWFKTIMNGAFDNENEAKQRIKELKETNKDISKRSKRKTEYEVREEEYIPYVYKKTEKKEPKKRGRKPKSEK